jgi:hypothetical protein
MTQNEACKAYMKLLKDEDLTPDQRALARESFNEGWLQCELNKPSEPQAIRAPSSASEPRGMRAPRV